MEGTVDSFFDLCKKGDLKKVKLFLEEHGPEQKDKRGNDALHILCKHSDSKDHFEIIKYLIEYCPKLLVSKNKRKELPSSVALNQKWINQSSRFGKLSKKIHEYVFEKTFLNSKPGFK